MIVCAIFLLVETQLPILGKGGVSETLCWHFHLRTNSDIGIDTKLASQRSFWVNPDQYASRKCRHWNNEFCLGSGAIGLSPCMLGSTIASSPFPRVAALRYAYQSCTLMKKAQAKFDFIPMEKFSISICRICEMIDVHSKSRVNLSHVILSEPALERRALHACAVKKPLKHDAFRRTGNLPD